MFIEIRKANITDCESLFELNEEFNGKGCTTKELLQGSIANNEQESVFVAVIDGISAGFCCVQFFKSMCYDKFYLEITELYVNEVYRKQGVATKLMDFAQNYFKADSIGGYQLFTGEDNYTAQRFYEKIGYEKTDEIMYRKRI